MVYNARYRKDKAVEESSPGDADDEPEVLESVEVSVVQLQFIALFDTKTNSRTSYHDCYG